MQDDHQNWRVGGRLALPLVLTLLLFVVTEALSGAWPTRVGTIQTVGLMLATLTGVVVLPGLSWKAKAVIAILYCPVVYWVLFFFGLWFVGVFYGNTL